MIGSKSLLIALLSGGIGIAGMQVVRTASAASSAAPSVQKMDDDQYPHMRHALEDLRHARHSLEDAEPRFHGHRDKAIEHVDKAIKECEDALAEG